MLRRSIQRLGPGVSDPYRVLGLTSSANADAVKAKYHELAMKFHPDRTNGDDTKFKEINHAYEMIRSGKYSAERPDFTNNDGASYGHRGAESEYVRWQNAYDPFTGAKAQQRKRGYEDYYSQSPGGRFTQQEPFRRDYGFSYKVRPPQVHGSPRRTIAQFFMLAVRFYVIFTFVVIILQHLMQSDQRAMMYRQYMKDRQFYEMEKRMGHHNYHHDDNPRASPDVGEPQRSV